LEENRAHRLAFPEQHSMTRNLRKAASAAGNADFLPMWAGQGLTMTRVMPAAELVGSLVAEAQSLLSNGHARSGIAPDVRADGRNGSH
ncbi:MAG TPA: nitronate monooxygenase, partial [Bradyrhizobium sp.]|nr:nitronate monooxygenase [Bradyrhizobium sp.]